MYVAHHWPSKADGKPVETGYHNQATGIIIANSGIEIQLALILHGYSQLT